MYKKRVFRSVLILECFLLCLTFGVKDGKEPETKREAVYEFHDSSAGVAMAFQEHIFEAGIIPKDLQIVRLTVEEKASLVYTFLQGPRAYREKWPWSGDWCERLVQGNSFGAFGCGLCCMANIYSTLSGYECSPWDMYEFATQASLYYPSSESGAIGWEDMQTTLTAAGFSCSLCVKPATYEEFQEQMKHTQSAIVLVSSNYDATYWQNTPGHYVTIFLYDEEKDKVFLADSGEPKRNRRWISLKKVYKSLKTASTWQYLPIGGYDGKKDEWKHKKADGNWVH